MTQKQFLLPFKLAKMKMIEVPIGEIFNIENTPTFPKLKIRDGYVDMRDEIINKSGNCDDRDVVIMQVSDIVSAFKNASIQEIEEWVKEVKKIHLQ